jgi:hypothetical protein
MTQSGPSFAEQHTSYVRSRTEPTVKEPVSNIPLLSGIAVPQDLG